MVQPETIKKFQIIASQILGYSLNFEEATNILSGMVGYFDNLARLAHLNEIRLVDNYKLYPHAFFMIKYMCCSNLPQNKIHPRNGTLTNCVLSFADLHVGTAESTIFGLNSYSKFIFKSYGKTIKQFTISQQ